MTLARELGLRIAAILGVLVLLVLFNRDLLRVRLDHLAIMLDQAAEAEQTTAAKLLGRYELIRRRIEAGEGELDGFRLELQLATLSRPPAPEQTASRDDRVDPGFAVANGIRFLMGKDPLEPPARDSLPVELDRAYALERARRWDEAIAAYEDILVRERVRPATEANVLLHIGFARSMLGNRADARTAFLRVIERHPGTEHALAAGRLLSSLDSLDETLARAPRAQDPTDPLGQAIFAYLQLDFPLAIERLTAVLAAPGTRAAELEARFFLARALEESGAVEAAVQQYQAVSLAADSEWALQADRRLVLIGEVYTSQPELAQAARSSLAEREDGAFLDTLQPYVALAQPLETVPDDPPVAAIAMTALPTAPLAPAERATSPPQAAPVARPDVTPAAGERAETRRAALETRERGPEPRFTESDRESVAAVRPAEPRQAMPPPAPPVQPTEPSPELRQSLREAARSIRESSELPYETVVFTRDIAEQMAAGAGYPEEWLRRARHVADAADRRWEREEELRSRISELDRERSRVQRQSRTRATIQWAATGIAATTLATGAVSLAQGNARFEEYQDATLQQDALRLRRETERYQRLTIASGAALGVSVGVAVLTGVLRARNNPEREIEGLEREIRLLRTEFGYRGELPLAEERFLLTAGEGG